LASNPDHVEANYNLTNVLEGKDDLENSVLFYKKAIHEDTGKSGRKGRGQRTLSSLPKVRSQQ
jgi:hypothetical protein